LGDFYEHVFKAQKNRVDDEFKIAHANFIEFNAYQDALQNCERKIEYLSLENSRIKS